MSTSHTPTPLAGRVAIITGGSRGIGRAITKHLASLGARVAINYVTSSAPADDLAAELNSNSTSLLAIAIKADVSDPESVRSLFDKAEQAFNSPAHILVTCAGFLDSNYPTLANTTLENFDKSFNVNVKGTFLCCREAANRLSRNGGGRIVTFSSSIVGTLIPGYSVYTATNAAVETMTRILAKELKGEITANCVAPGPVITELFMQGMTEEKLKFVKERSSVNGRIGETEDIAPVVAFLVKDEAAWVNGQVIRVNGGFV